MSARRVAQGFSECSPSRVDDLYFIRVLPDGPVKIGRSVDVWKRQASMQSNNPFELDCICRLVGRGFEEVAWHAAFGDATVRGEWFNWSPELEHAIAYARHEQPWWEHLDPPRRYMDDQSPSDDDEWRYAVIDWHIAIQSHCTRPSPPIPDTAVEVGS